MTLSSPLKTQPLKLENITTYESKLKPKQNTAKTGVKFTDDDARLGDYWEYYVALKASERGAEVFKNIYRTGATDLVLEWEGMILKCDVKQMREQNGYWKTNGAKKRGSAHVYVNPITHQIRWIKGQEPQGWEGFWK